MAIVDKRGAYIYPNRAFCQMTGFEEQELCGMHFTETSYPEDRELRLEMFAKIMAGEIGSYNIERRLLRKDGKTAWVRSSITVPIELDGSRQVIVILEDITERKETEAALQASEERFRIAAENASDMIYEWDLRTGKMQQFGQDHQRLGDWQAPGNHEAWKRMVHPDDLERVLAASARHIQNGERYNDEYRVVGREGKIYHYSNRGQVILTATGEPNKCIGLLSDITESRLAEEAVSQLAAIVQCSEDAIVATSTTGAIITWNNGAQKLLGYTAAEALALPIAALFTSPDLARDILSQIRQGQSARLDEAEFQRSDGSQVPVSLTVSPIQKSDGRVTGSAIIARDISALKQTEREMAHRALHDHLTGLPNRSFLANGLAESIASADLGFWSGRHLCGFGRVQAGERYAGARGRRSSTATSGATAESLRPPRGSAGSDGR